MDKLSSSASNSSSVCEFEMFPPIAPTASLMSCKPSSSDCRSSIVSSICSRGISSRSCRRIFVESAMRSMIDRFDWALSMAFLVCSNWSCSLESASMRCWIIFRFCSWIMATLTWCRFLYINAFVVHSAACSDQFCSLCSICSSAFWISHKAKAIRKLSGREPSFSSFTVLGVKTMTLVSRRMILALFKSTKICNNKSQSFPKSSNSLKLSDFENKALVQDVHSCNAITRGVSAGIWSIVLSRHSIAASVLFKLIIGLFISKAWSAPSSSSMKASSPSCTHSS